MFILSLYPSRVLVGGSASSIWARIPGIFLVGLKVVCNGIHEREGVTVDICIVLQLLIFQQMWKHLPSVGNFIILDYFCHFF